MATEAELLADILVLERALANPAQRIGHTESDGTAHDVAYRPFEELQEMLAAKKGELTELQTGSSVPRRLRFTSFNHKGL